MNHEQYMRRALELAMEAQAEGDVPVGCVIVRNGEIVGEGDVYKRQGHQRPGRDQGRPGGGSRQHRDRARRRRVCGCLLYTSHKPHFQFSDNPWTFPPIL